MASCSSSFFSISSSSTLVYAKAPRQPSVTSPQCVSIPTLPPPPVQSHNRPWKVTSYLSDVSPQCYGHELPKILKTIQEVRDKVEDKYAVSSLAVAGAVALWGSTRMISAIDMLPLIPGVLEIVGIGYTGWFAYKNLVFKHDKEALIAKVKST